MSTSAEAGVEAAAETSAATRTGLASRLLGALLGLTVLGLGVYGLLVGSVPASNGLFYQQLVDGQVSRVAVDDWGNGNGNDGTVTVRWEGSVVDRHSEFSPQEHGGDADALVEEWLALNPNLVVGADGHGPADGALKGVEMPGWVVLALGVLSFGALIRVIFAGATSVFSKWGWFWLVLVPVVGAAAFFAFGDERGRSRDGRGKPRYDGLAGFALAVALGMAWNILLGPF